MLTPLDWPNALREKIRFLTRALLLVVGEIGYLPVTPGGANLFFQLVNARYETRNERGGLILTGQQMGNPKIRR
ncbi:IstB-like ATP binding protein [Sphingomonas laterariae]|uniref:IstB-like ATP binding protein n=1 Tax=Edaphosphingomonas laterariae TaxID=861865 RepID=A0A239L2I1_9SPHN|nr:ATP-binding protein [Sphingomonas laterariae]SNT24520.1 IstB-like ATP binding protein [Sphingomonas laterariae]